MTGTAAQVLIVDEFSLNQEEAENKVILHATYAIKTTESSIILRFLFGEDDIMIITMSVIDISKR